MVDANEGDKVRLFDGSEGVVVYRRMGPVDQYLVSSRPFQYRAAHRRCVVENLGPVVGPQIGDKAPTPRGMGIVVGQDPDGRYRVTVKHRLRSGIQVTSTFRLKAWEIMHNRGYGLA